MKKKKKERNKVVPCPCWHEHARTETVLCFIKSHRITEVPNRQTRIIARSGKWFPRSKPNVNGKDEIIKGIIKPRDKTRNANTREVALGIERTQMWQTNPS